MGQEYMTVRATEVTREYNNASGGSSGDTVTYRIGWTAEGGLTGNGWFWNATPITTWWEANYEKLNTELGENYTNDQSSFERYAARVDNLDAAFKSWDAGLKFLFLANNPVFEFDSKTGEFGSDCVSMV
jgi:hypothetical protein